MIINKAKDHQVSITPDTITLRFGEMEPVVIPRANLRTRLQLMDWVYRLTGWPGMNLRGIRTFIATISRHHGWALPKPKDDLIFAETPPSAERTPNTPQLVGGG